MRRSSFFLLALVWLTFSAGVARATPVVVAFEVLVQLRGTEGPNNLLTDEVQIGDTITGTFTVDSDGLVPTDSDPTSEAYIFLDLGITLLTFATHEPLGPHDEEIFVGLLSDRHIYNIHWQDDFDGPGETSGTLDSATVDGFDFDIRLRDSSASALTSDAALPLPALSLFDSRYFHASGDLVGSSDFFSVTGEVTSFTLVPVRPPSWF